MQTNTATTLTVSATGVDKVYDGTTNATVTLSDNRISGDVFTDNYTTAGFADKNVGNGKTVTVFGISISGLNSGNYTLNNTTASTTANITNATLTIKADNKTRVVGQTNPPLTVTYIGFVTGEGINQLNGAPDLSTTADTNSPAGSYPITVTMGSLSAANYSFNFVNGTLTVTPPMQGGPLAVAIHESELTLALESMPASGDTPTGPKQPAINGGCRIGTITTCRIR